MTFGSVDHAQLASIDDGALLVAFQASVREAVVAATAGIVLDDVGVELKSSTQVRANIHPPNGVEVDTLVASLASSTALLRSSIETNVNGLAGIEGASTGDISVSDLAAGYSSVTRTTTTTARHSTTTTTTTAGTTVTTLFVGLNEEPEDAACSDSLYLITAICVALMAVMLALAMAYFHRRWKTEQKKSKRYQGDARVARDDMEACSRDRDWWKGEANSASTERDKLQRALNEAKPKLGSKTQELEELVKALGAAEAALAASTLDRDAARSEARRQRNEAEEARKQAAAAKEAAATAEKNAASASTEARNREKGSGDRDRGRSDRDRDRDSKPPSRSRTPPPGSIISVDDAAAAPDTLQLMCDDIDTAVKSLLELPAENRAAELRTLKRTYHPDAQRVKSEAMQKFFTQLSQHINGYCEAHLRRDCPKCADEKGRRHDGRSSSTLERMDKRGTNGSERRGRI